MKAFLADLDLISSTLSLDEVAALVGHPPGPASHDRGERRPTGRVWDQTIWRLSSTAGDHATLAEHLAHLRCRAEEIGLLDPSPRWSEVLRVLNIAVLNDAFTCAVTIPPGSLLPFLAAGFDLELSVYPVDDEPDATGGD